MSGLFRRLARQARDPASLRVHAPARLPYQPSPAPLPEPSAKVPPLLATPVSEPGVTAGPERPPTPSSRQDTASPVSAPEVEVEPKHAPGHPTPDVEGPRPPPIVTAPAEAASESARPPTGTVATPSTGSRSTASPTPAATPAATVASEPRLRARVPARQAAPVEPPAAPDSPPPQPLAPLAMPPADGAPGALASPEALLPTSEPRRELTPPRTRPESATSRPADSGPAEVHVHIGRIEVTAPSSAPGGNRKAARSDAGLMSLDDYLTRRREERS